MSIGTLDEFIANWSNLIHNDVTLFRGDRPYLITALHGHDKSTAAKYAKLGPDDRLLSLRPILDDGTLGDPIQIGIAGSAHVNVHPIGWVRSAAL